jgi:predicted ATPase
VAIELRNRARSRRAPQADALVRMEVLGLFGKYDFPNIELHSGDRNHPNLAFLYGENGVGKTTILRLIYLILDYTEGSGSKSELAKIKFESVTLYFKSGRKISVTRPSANSGSYNFRIEGEGEPISYIVRVDSDDDVIDSEPTIFPRLYNGIQNLGFDVVFLSDSRTLRASFKYSKQDDSATSYAGLFRNINMRDSIRGRMDEHSSTSIRTVISAAYDSILSKSIIAGSAGDQEAALVYLNVAKAIVGPSGSEHSDRSNTRMWVLDELTRIESLIPDYIRFELTTDFRISEIRKLIERSKPNASAQLYAVLTPYIESIRERLEALAPVMRLMKILEDNLNGFLRRKTVKVSRVSGINFFDFDGEPLSPVLLSSGERHLIFLFCVSLLSSSRNLIILVDEPELSLNFKWQRVLVENLLELSRSGAAQYIFASHSMEIMSHHGDAIQTLQPSINR